MCEEQESYYVWELCSELLWYYVVTSPERVDGIPVLLSQVDVGVGDLREPLQLRRRVFEH